MKLKIVAAIAGLLLLAACETAPQGGAGADGTGGEDGTDGTYTHPLQGELAQSVGDRVFFAYDSSVLDHDAQRTLERQVAWFQSHPELNIILEGHCDERGTREYNLALGERRANAAKRYLVSLGLDANRISTISYGKERPSVLGSNESAWAQNRRAVTVIAR